MVLIFLGTISYSFPMGAGLGGYVVVKKNAGNWNNYIETFFWWMESSIAGKGLKRAISQYY
jgi:hypothetical protein